MTNEEAIKILEKMKARMIPLGPLLEGKSKDEEAVDMAIEALSKQCASCEQADKKLFDHGYWLAPGEVFISHNVLNEVLNTIIKSMDTVQCKIDSTLVKTSTNDEAIRKDDQIAESDKMVDQFRAPTKKTEDVHDIRVGKTDFKPEPVTNCHGLMDDLISRAAAIDILYNFAGCIADTPGDWYKAFEKYKYDLENLPSAQPEINTDGDTISRQAAIDAVRKNTFRLIFSEEQNCEGHVAWSANAVYSDVMEGALLELPSAQPERKTGRW
jgi:hypothetical protein